MPAVVPAPRSGTPASVRLLGWWVLPTLIVLCWLLVEPVRLSADSMEPSYADGQLVLVDKLSTRLREVERREVVVVRSPVDGGLLIKRVVAVAGDVVGLEDGALVVNGERPRETFGGEGMDGVYFGPVEVPPSHTFLLGDNRAASVDSRRFGAVPTDRIVGRVLCTLW